MSYLPCAVVETLVNGGSTQRSNIETVSLRFNEDSNISALIASGEVLTAVKLFKSDGDADSAGSREIPIRSTQPRS